MRVHFDSSHLFFTKKRSHSFLPKTGPPQITKGMRVGEGTQVGDADGGCSGGGGEGQQGRDPGTPPTPLTAPAGTPTARD